MWLAIRFSGCFFLWLTVQGRAATVLVDEEYNQWKQALNTNAATAAAAIKSPAGFKVELIRSARSDEGSWVAMTFDPDGLVVLAREDRGLLRLTLAPDRASVTRVETINTNLLECRGLLFAHGALYANANNSKSLVRLRDVNRDGDFDEIKVLRHTPGGVGHGRNQLALGPDGFIYSIHGDDVRLPTNGVSPSSPFRHYAEDRLLPCEWDRHLFNADASMPFGHVIRTDRDGRMWELMAGGLRNPFGIDFNAAGDLFTFDADMEWDVGLSWYHPTRVLHLVPGGDYGWRRGTGVLPAWLPDTLPAAVDIGQGSPTAIKFGTKSNWPERWRRALFIQDWAYGRIMAVHLKKKGATYGGSSEEFLKGRPLNVTGLEFGPDGAMYFTTGGRRTQSGLYRVSWTGKPDLERAEAREAERSDARRVSGDLWSRLNDSDHWTRYGARVELEAMPAGDWSNRALEEEDSFSALTALLALSRCGEASLQPRILERLLQLALRKLDPDQQLLAVRAFSVCFIRMGRPEATIARRALEVWEPQYPAGDAQVSQSLCELLVYLGSSQVVARTIPRLASAVTQEEKFHYLFTLRLVTDGWTFDTRRTYFEWLGRARREFNGANMLPTALNYIRAEAESTLTPDERHGLSETLAALDNPVLPVTSVAPRAFVKEWTMAELEPALARRDPRNLTRGRRLFNEVGCAQCHRMGREGGVVGPDLTTVASRFDRRALLESLVEPSRVIAENYRNMMLTLKTGAIHDGRIVSEDSKSIVLATNPVDPDRRQGFAKSEIVSRRVTDD
jgi:putative heme-binding domain-containing protein